MYLISEKYYTIVVSINNSQLDIYIKSYCNITLSFKRIENNLTYLDPSSHHTQESISN